MYIKWDITSKCNLNCIHCCESGGHLEDSELTTEQIFFIIDKLKLNYKELDIQFIGGEPFARADFENILQYCKNNNVGIGITTNGTYDMNYLFKLLREKKDYPVAIFFSLDGPNEKTNDIIRGNGVFSKCLNNINKLSKFKSTNRNLFIGLGATISKVNLNYIDEYFDIYKNSKIDMINFTFIDNVGNAAVNYNKLYISNIEKINAVYRIANESAKFKNLYVKLPIPEKAAVCIDNKFGTKFSKYDIFKSGPSCDPKSSGLNINNKGFATICDRIDRKSYMNATLDLDNYDNIKSITHIKKDLLYLQSKADDLKKSLSNNSCSFKEICYICPLKTNDFILSQCEFCKELCSNL